MTANITAPPESDGTPHLDLNHDSIDDREESGECSAGVICDQQPRYLGKTPFPVSQSPHGLPGDTSSPSLDPSAASMDRISQLEAKLAEMDSLKATVAFLDSRLGLNTLREPNTSSGRKSSRDVQPRFQPSDKPLSLEIKRLSIIEWRPSRGFEREDIRSNVLVVYYGHSDRQRREVDENGYRIHRKPPVLGNRAEHEDEPKRVQINSRLLLDELEVLSGVTMSKVPAVFIPPFKVFVSSRDRIAREVQKLKEALLAKPPANARDKLMKESTISHLEALLSFIDEELKEKLHLRKQISDSTLETIAFQDIWHLFPPGELVFSQLKKQRDTDILSYPRAFRVFCVGGGRMHLRSKPPPGSTYGRIPRPDEAERVPVQPPSDPLLHDFHMDLHYVDFDGEHLGPETLGLATVIRPFTGVKKIVDLDFYPAKFAPDYEAIKQRLILRGKRFVELISVSHKMYDGCSTGSDPEEVNGEVMVDTLAGYRIGKSEAALKDLDIDSFPVSSTVTDDCFEWTQCLDEECPGCTNNFDDNQYELRRFDDYRTGRRRVKTLWIPDEIDLITDDHLLLLPRDVLSFVFRSRSWKYLNVDCMADINPHADGGFDDVVIDPKHKEMLRALVESHCSGVHSDNRGAPHRDGFSMDLVKGKGKGLVILLHGAPGVGKTLTAETIAAYTRRPLYPITCGDIGETAVDVERNLERHFRLAHQWGCVLLLDEADVFLAQRDHHDIRRNALVSVFLRTLEYYSGILFLTTNRVGAIDEAFHSRIKMSFLYPELTQESTEKIWQNSLSRIERQNNGPETSVPITFDRKNIVEFAVKHYKKLSADATKSVWNGRQIRNGFQTALALAQYDRLAKIKKKGLTEAEAQKKKRYREAVLTTKHFKRVEQVMHEYEQYRLRLNGNMASEEIAEQQGWRAVWPTEAGTFSPGSGRAERQFSWGQSIRPSAGRRSTGGSAKARKQKMDKIEQSDSDLESGGSNSTDEDEDEDEDSCEVYQ